MIGDGKVMEEKEEETDTQATEIAQGENELDFWLKGHMTGETRKREEEDKEEFDEGASPVNNLL